MVGIYLIENLVNGKCYIGSSNNVELRLRHHRKELRGNYHSNTYLQRAFNKYGENSFSFRLLKECDIKLLRQLEQKYIIQHLVYIRSIGYNLNQIATGGPNKKYFNCRIKNCEDEYLAKGYCNKHYRRLRRNGSVSVKLLKQIRRKDKICRKSGCNEKHDSHGYCQKHAYYYRKYGRVTRKNC